MEMRKGQFNEKEDFQTLNIMLNGNKKKAKGVYNYAKIKNK